MDDNLRTKERVLIVVMDGVGMKESRFGNAVNLAHAPNLARIKKLPLYTTLDAHGTAVGLPSDDDIGNSEVGHNALGAGRIFAQGAKLVNRAIEDGSLFQGQAWKDLIQSAKAQDGTLHFLGLLSDGNVHSHEQHLYAMLRAAKTSGVKRVRIHTLLDGRDVGEKSAEIYATRLQAVTQELQSPSFDVQVASGGGRMNITMDRYNADWTMVQRGWETHVLGRAPFSFTSLEEAINHFRKDPALTDQYLPAFVIVDPKTKQPVGTIQDGDSVIFFNFRGDRAIEISRAFTEHSLSIFDRERFPKVTYAGMMEYDGDLHIPARYLVNPPAIDHTLTEYLLTYGVRQFACSETQKFGHVTFFWNGNRSGYFNRELEEYLEIPSDVIPFNQRPKMQAERITDETIRRMEKGSFDFGRINYANGDMVGHTGDLPAAIKAIETVDAQLGRLFAAADATGTTLIITADHGNADEMFDGKEKDFPEWEAPHGKKPQPKTSHTLTPVPFAIYGKGSAGYALSNVGRKTLAHVANTAIELLGLPTNPLYLPSLIKRTSNHG